MRALTGPERALLASGDGFLTKARLRVTNFDGGWIDLGALAIGTRTLRLFNTATIADDIDRNTLSMSATVKREAGAYSLSPFMSSSPLNDAGDGTFSPLVELHREWAIDAVFTARGVTPTLPDDYREVKSGFIDALDISGAQNTITVTGYGREKDLIDRRILFIDRTATPLVAITKETPKVYAGGDIADVLQAILDEEVGVGVVPLTLAASAPSYFVNGWTQTESVGLFDLLSQIAGLPGAALRYLYDASDVLTLTLFTPPRTKTTPDWEISGTMELETLDVGIGLERVRNFPVVRFMNTAGAIQTVTSPATPASASITRYGERPIEIDLSADTKVNDATSAQLLADAVKSDWELPYMEQRGTAHGLWFAELHDLVRTKANGMQYDEDQDGAIVGYTMTFANGMLANAFAFSGKVKGRYATWLSFGGSAGVVVAPAITSSDATFEDWFPPLTAGTCRVHYVATANSATRSVLVELSLFSDASVVLDSGTYTPTADVAQAGYFYITDADRSKTYYFRLTPYDGPMVSGAPTGIAGEPATVHTHAAPLRATVASVTTVSSDVAALTTVVATKAPLASPALTGTPTAPTASAGTNTTQLATTAYVDTGLALKANLASPTFTGDPKAPTPSNADNDTSIATTAFVKAVISAAGVGGVGGTGSYTVFDPDAPFASPSALDDEFAAATVDAKWTQVNAGSATSIDQTTIDGQLRITKTSNNGTKIALLQAIPAGDFTAFLKMDHTDTVGDFWTAGFSLTDGTTAGAGNQYIIANGYSGGRKIFVIQETNFNTFITTTYSAAQEVHAPYLRLSRSGTTLSLDASFTGLTWINSTSWTSAFTLTHIGITYQHQRASAIDEFFSEFFRVKVGTALARLGARRVIVTA